MRASEIDEKLGYSCVKPIALSSSCARNTVDSSLLKRASKNSLAARRSLSATVELTIAVKQRDELLQIANGGLSDGMCHALPFRRNHQ